MSSKFGVSNPPPINVSGSIQAKVHKVQQQKPKLDLKKLCDIVAEFLSYHNYHATLEDFENERASRMDESGKNSSSPANKIGNNESSSRPGTASSTGSGGSTSSSSSSSSPNQIEFINNEEEMTEEFRNQIKVR